MILPPVSNFEGSDSKPYNDSSATCVCVFKDTSLVLWIGIIELLKSSQIIITRTQEPILILTIAGILYFTVSFCFTRVTNILEKRWERYEL